MLKKIVNDNELWDQTLREVVTQAFTKVSKGDKSMNVIEFDQWILKGWMRMQTQLKDAKPRLIQGVLDAEAYSASKQEQIEENKRRRPRTAGERLQRESVSAKGYDTGNRVVTRACYTSRGRLGFLPNRNQGALVAC